MNARLHLKNEQWEQVRGLFPERAPGSRGRPPKDNRLMVEAMIWFLRTGSPWRDLPVDFGPWQSVRTRLRRWSEAGIWERAWRALRGHLGEDHEEAFIDSTALKAHKHARGAQKKAGPPGHRRGPRRSGHQGAPAL
jgi:transposase